MKQTPRIQLDDSTPPAPGQAAYGTLRDAVLDAMLIGREITLPAILADDLISWAEAEVAASTGAPRGLDPRDVPMAYLPVLRWAGVPLAVDGELRWGEHFCIEQGVPRPEDDSGCLLLPEPKSLAAMSSLAIKPVRSFVAQKLGLRLQIGTGVGMFLWTDRAVLTSSAAVPLAGFLHGPERGRRSNLALDPGGWQAVDLI